MNPDLLLGVVTALVGFLLKTSLAFAVCLGLSWLDNSPGRRFLVWLSFLYGMAAYWLWLGSTILPSAHLAGSRGPSLVPAVTPAGGFEIPGSWAVPLGLALRVIGIAYILISSYMLFLHVKKLRQLKWILGFTSQPPAEMEEVFQPLAKKLHAGRSRLLVLSGATSPATFGWLWPTIVVPDVCLQQDRSELEDILRHELHHVRRWDFVWNGISVACRALLFFHPAAWYAVRKMEFDRELACDLAAVSDSPKARAKYAECLIHFARLNANQEAGSWGLDFAASSEHLKTRVHSILAGSKKLSIWLVCTRVACGLVLLAGFLRVEPSLGVLLSYTQQQMSQPLTAIETTPGKTQSLVKPGKRGRLTKASSSPQQDGVRASLGQTTQAADSPPDPGREVSSLSEGTAGPQLLHRGSPASGNARKQQIVVPIEDGNGQSIKAGEHDRKQTLQQTATTAAGLYRRLADLDRH
jgi:beta-lactamase regulating signal transducer with metallopeptidase domain